MKKKHIDVSERVNIMLSILKADVKSNPKLFKNKSDYLDNILTKEWKRVGFNRRYPDVFKDLK